ncbi:TPA: hypothetical protein MHT78_27310 [Klebsiella pneumoniae]|nr:hypothetical protein [Klebsiella pneumoniae]HBY2344262.1 hypothetical protein [Klebsiella pneumoniae]
MSLHHKAYKVIASGCCGRNVAVYEIYFITACVEPTKLRRVIKFSINKLHIKAKSVCANFLPDKLAVYKIDTLRHFDAITIRILLCGHVNAIASSISLGLIVAIINKVIYSKLNNTPG